MREYRLTNWSILKERKRERERLARKLPGMVSHETVGKVSDDEWARRADGGREWLMKSLFIFLLATLVSGGTRYENGGNGELYNQS